MNPRLPLTLPIALIIAALVLGAAQAIPPLHEVSEGPATAGEQELAPPIALETLAGGRISLNELRGQWVLVNFWATWCIPCREEMPYLQQVADDYAGRLTVLAVNLREPVADIQSYAAELGLRFRILVAPDDALLLAYDVRGVPLTVVIAPDGRLVHRQIGPLRAPVFDRWLADHLH
jgi:thiol-disulfide isomerase/thioredoxin